ncbi:MAG TPA: peptidylprolyl isomerase, partial [Vicinamibacterales bacterium]|nr:peptidylprolyl isomerase [Vicinamibacterales bacterium]
MTRRVALGVVLLGALVSARQASFSNPYLPDQMRGKQAVVETDMGTFVLELLPDVAPNHVGYFMKLVGEGAYDGTIFHRVIRYGLIQGGDPLSTD